jgi:hypothetical protein
VERKLDTAHVFERIFAIYRSHAGVLLGVAVVVYLLAALITGILASTGSIAAVLVGLAVTLITTFVYDAMVVELVSDVQDGRLDQTVGGMVRSVTPVLPTLLIASLLGGLGIALGFVLLIVPGLVLLTWWALTAPVVIVERAAAVAALGRSRELVRGSGWQVFGVLLVILLINAIVSGVFNSIGATAVFNAIFSLIGNVLLAPLHAIAVATMFFELKAIHEEPAREPAPPQGDLAGFLPPTSQAGPPPR